jgi:RNA polymerase sigma-70 factor (ECF subfamily)
MMRHPSSEFRFGFVMVDTPDPIDGQSESNELPPSDERLLDQVKARDGQAFSLLFDRYARPVYALAAHLLGTGEADEIVQEVFWRIWQRAHQFDPARGSARVWIMTVARHQVFDALKRRSQEQRQTAVDEIERLLADMPVAAGDVAELAWRRQQVEAMQHALQTLPDEQRHVLMLAYFGGFSQSDIATRLGWPLGTVKKRVRLALQKLRTALLKWNEVD